jgi:hypothetical protein
VGVFNGEVTKITNDLNNYAGLSVTADGRSLVTTQATVNAALWVLPAGDSRDTRQVMTGLGQVDGVRGVTWTLDERLVFTSRVGDRDGLYIADADGLNPTLVVSATTLHSPSVCGAGGTIVYTGNVGQGPRFFRVGPERPGRSSGAAERGGRAGRHVFARWAMGRLSVGTRRAALAIVNRRQRSDAIDGHPKRSRGPARPLAGRSLDCLRVVGADVATGDHLV